MTVHRARMCWPCFFLTFIVKPSGALVLIFVFKMPALTADDTFYRFMLFFSLACRSNSLSTMYPPRQNRYFFPNR